MDHWSQLADDRHSESAGATADRQVTCSTVVCVHAQNDLEGFTPCRLVCSLVLVLKQ